MPRRGKGWDYAGWYRRVEPRDVRGGIKARTKRGEFGESWWAKRWIGVLEGSDLGKRLGRGRTVARRGQVMDIRVAAGEVRARVQGTRATPYEVTIKVETLDAATWENITAALASRAVFAAKLLAGEMPHEVETAFADAGASLFPERFGDLVTSCSCPDAANPCKHVAAVTFLLGEEFDRDPFLVFKLRGMPRDALVARLGAASAHVADDGTAPAEPLASEPGAFWGTAEAGEIALGEVRPPPVAAALPRRLGEFPFWRGSAGFLDALEPVYVRASERALDALAGEQAPPGPGAVAR